MILSSRRQDSDFAETTSSGRLFQTRDAPAEKAVLLTVDSLHS